MPWIWKSGIKVLYSINNFNGIAPSAGSTSSDPDETIKESCQTGFQTGRLGVQSATVRMTIGWKMPLKFLFMDFELFSSPLENLNVYGILLQN